MTDLRIVGSEDEPGKPAPRPGPNQVAMRTLLAVCAAERELGVLIGRPGVGKTTAVLAFREEGGMLYLRATSSMRNPRSLMLALAEKLGISRLAHGNNPYLLHRDVRSGLAQKIRYEGLRLIVVDEAQYLRVGALEALRDLFDEVEIGIVLVGNHALGDFLERAKASGDYEMGPLLSRVFSSTEIEAPTEADVAAMVDDAELMATAGALLMRAAEEGGLRSVDALLRKARGLANGRITARHVKDASGMIGVGRLA